MGNKQALCAINDIPESEIRGFSLPDGTQVALYKIDGDVFATADLCTHGQSSLSEEGTLTGRIVECAWHYGAFDVTTGMPCAMPCTVPLKTFPVTVANGMVYVEF